MRATNDRAILYFGSFIYPIKSSLKILLPPGIRVSAVRSPHSHPYAHAHP